MINENKHTRLLNLLSYITIITLLGTFYKLAGNPEIFNHSLSISEPSSEVIFILIALLVIMTFIIHHYSFTLSPILDPGSPGSLAGYNINYTSDFNDENQLLERIQPAPIARAASVQHESQNNIQDPEETNTYPGETLSHFLANLTHELRTPMIGILGSVDLLEHSTLNHLQMASVDAIRECGERLLITIDDILEACKIDVGIVELNPSYTNLPHLVKKTVDALETNLSSKKLLLELDMDNLPSMVMVDQAKLRQIIINLLSNAIKFTPRGGIKFTVKIKTTELNDAWLHISVADTGIGIPPNQIGSIFNHFTQGDSSSSRQFGGNGLGLYICQKLIKLMGGEMRVTSKEGSGSTFSFKIPLEISIEKEQAEASAQVAAMLEEDIFNSGFTPVSVLLVEDNDLNQILMEQMLLSYGFEVITANNGLECLSILQRKNIDIVLMDMQMPVMDGYEATRLIRKNPSWEQLPIIAITANSLSSDRQKCLNCGCSSYLAKPFKSEALIREIKTYLKNQFIKDKNSDRLSQQLIADLLPEFMEMLKETLDELKRAIDEKDLRSIKQISHGLKGTAGMYGFMQISELAALIEKAMADKNYSRINLLYQQIMVLVKDDYTVEKSGVI